MRKTALYQLGRTAALALLLTACEDPEFPVPSADEVASHYSITARSEVDMNGNVAEVTVYQSTQTLRRGGTLWAKVGPYIYLFSDATQEAFAAYPGLAGVRVITRAQGGTEVARALLPRDALNELTWRRALNISGLARRDGTDRPSFLEDLVQWGEDHTEYEYNPSFIRRR